MTFRKTPLATSETDAYNELGLHCYYDSSDVITYAECHTAYGDVLFALDDWTVAGSWRFAVSQLRSFGFISEMVDEDGLLFCDQGLYLWHEDPDGDSVDLVAVIWLFAMKRGGR